MCRGSCRMVGWCNLASSKPWCAGCVEECLTYKLVAVVMAMLRNSFLKPFPEAPQWKGRSVLRGACILFCLPGKSQQIVTVFLLMWVNCVCSLSLVTDHYLLLMAHSDQIKGCTINPKLIKITIWPSAISSVCQTNSVLMKYCTAAEKLRLTNLVLPM